MTRQFVFTAVLAFSLFACDKEKITQNIVTYECEDNSSIDSPAIDDDEFQMITECDNNPLVEEEEIKNLLAGTWEMVGYAGGWFQTSSYKCIVLSFEENKMQKRVINDDEDTTEEYTWELDAYESNQQQYYSLKISDGNISYGFVNRFCDQFMYINDTPVDGDMQIFSKL